MPFNLTVPENLTRYLNPQAHGEAQNRVQLYAVDLLQEASRLETSSRTADADPQITSSMVADADLLLRRGYRQVRRGHWLTAAKIISPLGALVTGLFADTEKLKDPAVLVIFVICIIVTATSTVLTVVKE